MKTETLNAFLAFLSFVLVFLACVFVIGAGAIVVLTL